MILDISWNDFKAQVTGKGLRYSHVPDKINTDAYHLWSSDGAVTLYCLLIGDERADFIANYQANSNKRYLIGTDALPASPLTLMSHNMADKTTWWYDSAMVKDESLTEVSATSWQAANLFIIDLEHAKVCLEDDVAGTSRSAGPVNHGTKFSSTPGEHFLIPVCKVYNGATLLATLSRVDSSPGAGEYSIDYAAGIITTGDGWSGKTVKLSYHYARSSVYEYIPTPGKLIRLGHTEVNARNLNFEAAVLPVVYFEIWVGDTIKVRRIYKHVNDYMNQSVGAPQGWDDWCFPQWPYKLAETSNKDVTIAIESSSNMKIRLTHEDDSIPWGKKDTDGADPYFSVALHCMAENE